MTTTIQSLMVGSLIVVVLLLGANNKISFVDGFSFTRCSSATFRIHQNQQQSIERRQQQPITAVSEVLPYEVRRTRLLHMMSGDDDDDDEEDEDEEDGARRNNILDDLIGSVGGDDDDDSSEDYGSTILDISDLDFDDDDDTTMMPGNIDMTPGCMDDGLPPDWYVAKQRIDEARLKYRKHDKDTGSPEYQVAGMTERIAYLTRHLQMHPKDFSTRRGLVALVNKRRRLLNYLYKEDTESYKNIIKGLGIRHKAPGRVFSRQEKYGRYPKQKAIKKHIVKKKKRQAAK